MSMLPREPDHLLAWLDKRQHGLGASDFVPRSLYGSYVRDTVAAALRRTGNRAPVRFVDARATGFGLSDDGGFPFRLSNGDVLLAESAVLCLGANPVRLPLDEEAVSPSVRARVVEDPWRSDWRASVDPDDVVFLIGTGLTMIDQVLALVRQGHRGPIHALSRKGLLPQAHRLPRTAPMDLDLDPATSGLAAALRELRRAADGVTDWRGIMDGLRPVTPALWSGLSGEQRSRFLRHALPFWTTHRHRLAPALAAEIEELLQSGRLVVHKAGWSASTPTAIAPACGSASAAPRSASLWRPITWSPAAARSARAASGWRGSWPISSTAASRYPTPRDSASSSTTTRRSWAPTARRGATCTPWGP